MTGSAVSLLARITSASDRHNRRRLLLSPRSTSKCKGACHSQNKRRETTTEQHRLERISSTRCYFILCYCPSRSCEPMVADLLLVVADFILGAPCSWQS